MRQRGYPLSAQAHPPSTSSETAIPLNRRALIGSFATLVGGGVLWWNRHWLPTRGLVNPCLTPSLPDEIANHPAVAAATQGLRRDQVWDCHVHLLGLGDVHPGEVWVNPMMDSPWHPLQVVQKRLYLNGSCPTEDLAADEGYLDRLEALIEEMPAVRLMLMAFDYHHDEDGRRREELSTFHVSNAHARSMSERHDRLEWICSVHPYREDAVEALRWSARHGARAVKWLPPAMGMDPSSARCDGFYDAMRELDLPLLTHGGDELAVQGGGHQHLGNPLLLRRPLEHGVRVIVAHCASQGVGQDLRKPKKADHPVRNFELLLDMMREPTYEALLFGDISAVTQINRAPESLKTLLLAEDLHHRLINGSDYPLTGILPLFSAGQLRDLGLIDPDAAGAIFEVQKHNPLYFDLVLKRSLRWQGHRFPAAVFETARFFERDPSLQIGGVAA
jgi:predicted TIM-barrel fold metal-dependent hydrolase